MKTKAARAAARKRVLKAIKQCQEQGPGALRSLALEVGVPYGLVYNNCSESKLIKRILSYAINGGA